MLHLGAGLPSFVDPQQMITLDGAWLPMEPHAPRNLPPLDTIEAARAWAAWLEGVPTILRFATRPRLEQSPTVGLAALASLSPVWIDAGWDHHEDWFDAATSGAQGLVVWSHEVDLDDWLEHCEQLAGWIVGILPDQEVPQIPTGRTISHGDDTDLQLVEEQERWRIHPRKR